MRSVRSAARSFQAAVLAAAALTALPAAAHAADAPIRTIGFDEAGKRTAELWPTAISSDGKLVLLRGSVDQRYQAYLRDVVTGTTTRALPTGDVVMDASNDLSKLLVFTTRQVIAADTDAAYDLYLINRVSSQAQRITTGALAQLEKPTAVDSAALDGDPRLSGDGNVVVIGVSKIRVEQPSNPESPRTYTNEQWRFDATTGAATKVADTAAIETRRLDDAGRVAVNKSGILVDGRTLPLPFDAKTQQSVAWVAPDSSAVVARVVSDITQPLYLVNTTTGAARKIIVPAWLGKQGYSVWGLTGSDTLLLGTVYSNAGAARFVFGKLTVSTGALALSSGDIPITQQSAVAVISSNAQFAATSNHLAQIGTAALPGTEPILPPAPPIKALDYLVFQDVRCTNYFFYQTWYKPTLRLLGPQGTDLRAPTKADIKVTMNNGTVVNTFTLAPAKQRELATGRAGGFTYTAKVTFNDGTVAEGSQAVAPHSASPSAICPFQW